MANRSHHIRRSNVLLISSDEVGGDFCLYPSLHPFLGTFTGEGSSKKMAKAMASRDALRNEFNIIVVDGDDANASDSTTMRKHRKRHIEMANTKNPVQLLYELCLVQVL